MTTCVICNRKLTNPDSVAAGIGPICGNRGYKGRVYARFGGFVGWTDLLAWEKCNNPCYSCTFFAFPKKDEERTTSAGHVVKIGNQEMTFSRNALGGLCRKRQQLVDGNQIKSKADCSGSLYQARRQKHQQAKTGLYQYRDGQLDLFVF